MPPPGVVSMQSYAQMYALAGYFVFPMEVATKLPLVKWRKASTQDEKQIYRWWKRWPAASIGIDCGKSGMIVVDIDGQEGKNSWHCLLESYEAQLLNPTLVVTPSDGLHYWFKAPYDDDPPINSQSILGPKIDVRADGGLVVAPPSLHANGWRYMWGPRAMPRCSQMNTYPKWLIEHERSVRAIMAERASARAQVRMAQLAHRWGAQRDDRHPAYLAARTEGIVRAYVDQAEEGNRNRSLFRAACTLLEERLSDPSGVYDLVAERAMRRGLTAREVVTTVASAVRKHGGS